MKVLIVTSTVVVWGVATFLIYRLARFRPGHRGGGYFGTPPTSVFELLNAETYTAQGQRLVPYLWVALTILVICVGAVVFLVL